MADQKVRVVPVEPSDEWLELRWRMSGESVAMKTRFIDQLKRDYLHTLAAAPPSDCVPVPKEMLRVIIKRMRDIDAQMCGYNFTTHDGPELPGDRARALGAVRDTADELRSILGEE